MKNVFFILMILGFAVLSCRNSDAEDLQQIDQVFNVYIDSAGKDMLNPKISGAYSSLSINDVYGITDTAPVSSYSLKKNADSLNFIEYVAGAKRKLVDSSNVDRRIYESVLALNFVTLRKDLPSKITNDTLILRYSKSPLLFQIISAKYKSYNRITEFNKVEGQQNILKVHK